MRESRSFLSRKAERQTSATRHLNTIGHGREMNKLSPSRTNTMISAMRGLKRSGLSWRGIFDRYIARGYIRPSCKGTTGVSGVSGLKNTTSVLLTCEAQTQ